jgi:hypothetical protein
MQKIIILFIVLFLCICVCCINIIFIINYTGTGKYDENLLDDREIYIRIKNQTQYNIEFARIGGAYSKPGSGNYVQKNYSTTYGSVKSNEFSPYYKVTNVRIGYHRIEFTFNDELKSRVSVFPKDFEKILEEQPMSPVKWNQPYNQGVSEELGLVEGYYTFVVYDFQQAEDVRWYNSIVKVRIVKDK